MIVDRELDEMLNVYDDYHSSIIVGNNVEISVNYDAKENINIILAKKIKNEIVEKITLNFKDDFDFNTSILPKFIERFVSKNINISTRKIMGTEDVGNIILSRSDNKESLIIRNCSSNIMNLIELFEETYQKKISSPIKTTLNIALDNDIYEKYLTYNIALDYATYRTDFLDKMGKSNFFDTTTSKSFLEKENRTNETNLDNLIILDIARYAYRMGLDTGVEERNKLFDEIENYNNDEKKQQLCQLFRNFDSNKNEIVKKALICAEYERNNEPFINNNIDIIKEAIEAIENGVTYGNYNFLGYWDGRRRYYKLLQNDELVKICNGFLRSNRLIIDNEKRKERVANMVAKKKPSIISEIKNIKNNRPDFSTMINEPLEIKEKVTNEKLFRDEEHEQLAQGAKEQAKELMALIKERDQIKRDAEEFAKIILKNQRERKEIIIAAEEQAKKIFQLEKENEELKRLAEDNARSIFEKEKKQDEEIIKAAEEQARIIFNLEQENKELKRLAEENARLILATGKYYNEDTIKLAEEQAKRIFELEQENKELKRLAEENARNIFAREKRYEEEVRLRELEIDKPISQADIDKINHLLNALSMVKEIDFAVNHPTVMQEVSFLEEKIVTYLSTHKNIVSMSDVIKEEEQAPVPEKKSPPELLSIIRNVYTTSHMYEKEGRHTLINIIPTKDEKYSVTLYSVKNDTDDILTEAYFDKEFFREDTIHELCDIFSKNAVLIASKTDNLPNGLADYLVIDNQDNAIKFMGCSKEIIEIAKAYL